MSTTEIYGIKSNGNVVAYESVQNSWLGGMHVWNTLNEKYGFGGSWVFGFYRTWDSFNKGVYEDYENVVLGSTFSYAVVLKDDFEKLIDNFEKYHSFYPNSNFGEQIEVINSMKTDDDIIGVAWCQTFVADDLWDFSYDDKNEVIPYNIFKGDKHWNLFENLVS